MLLGTAALFTASIPGESQSPATARAGAASQDQAKPSVIAPRKQNNAAASGNRKIPCKTSENGSLCYWTHGRLGVYNGNPSGRIWKTGTRRLLGVFNGPSHFPPRTIADNESPELPLNLERAYEADHRRWKESGARYYEFPVIFADFEVCALEPEKKGEMQAVCVESATNIFLQRSY
jgi:hypothetical protein